MKSKLSYIIYRGPLERSRLAFILDTWIDLYEQITFIWVFPGNNFHTKQAGFQHMMKAYPDIKVVVMNDSATQLISTLKKIHQLVVKDQPFDLTMVGVSSPFFAWGLKPEKSFWFINGIPEERESYSSSLKLKLTTQLEWFLLKRLRTPDLIITVSTRMSNHLSKIFTKVAFVAVPTTVDTPTYSTHNQGQIPRKGYFTYLGSGAPWQSLDVLSSVWQEIHRIDSSVKFRVISRDYRTEILRSGIASTSIEFVASEHFEQIAKYLAESEVGFFIRRESLVNKVCFPTKMAEYLAGGCWLVTSDIDWDIADYIRQYRVGLLVNPDELPGSLAKKILDTRVEMNKDEQLAQRMEKCVIDLSREKWVIELRKILSAIIF